jgi:type III restriction enzyme
VGQPTQKIIENRRSAKFITPIPKPKKHKAAPAQTGFVFDEGKGLSTKEQQYDPTSIINEVRGHVDAWRQLSPSQWQVTPETTRLLQHWRHHQFSSQRPFFCQVEAAETAIWLTEVAPQSARGKRVLDHLAAANKDANPELMRLALKLATGAGKTTVMAMLIAWQTVNAVRHPSSKHFTRGFLVCAPGLTIKDRLRVLQPNDPDSYSANREIVPNDMLDNVNHAKIVITNFHAFKLRERIELSKGGRQLLQGRVGDELDTQETEGQMIQRVMPDLMGMKNILVINDEAHHCYREKPKEADDEELKGEDKKEAEKNNEAARLWISGLEAVNRKLGLSRVIDLSATPFFLRGSGYAEGTLFPWTMSDFSLMDAIECGIVKLPRVPVAENIPGDEMPMFRNLWENIRKDMPRKGRGQGEELDPLKLPTRLQTALQALYGHYETTFKLWLDKGIKVPPCFIIVCQNTAISKLVYDFISGFHRKREDGTTTLENGRLPLFRNFDDTTGNPLPRPNTLLIDSEQLEAGDALDDNFRGMAADEIERFRRERVERTGDVRAGENITDQELLREVMNTVGKPDQLGGSIRCVVSVSMLTEGWDANTVTHVLGIRAFGTQLLCEQVIGRAPRRQSYAENEEGLFDVEYADVFGVPFDFTAKPVIALPQPPRETVQVKAISPDRDALEIRFPRVEGYRVELPEERLTADFNDDSINLAPISSALLSLAILALSARVWTWGSSTWATCGHPPWSSTSPNACSTPSGAIRAKNRNSTCSANSSASPSSGSTPASCAKATPIPACSCTRNSPTWPATRSLRPSPDNSWATVPSRPCSIRITTRALPGTFGLTRHAPTAGTPAGRRRRIKSTGSSWTAIGRRSSAASPRRTPRCSPTPRTITSAWKSRIATARRRGNICPTSSCRWMMDMAPTTRSISWSRSRAIGARMPRKRKPRWRPIGCRA